MQGMVLKIPEITAWLGNFLWPFMRVAAMFSIAPVIGSRLVPMRVRILLSVLVVLALIPVLPHPPASEPLSSLGLAITANQILIGVAMGFILQLVFSTVAIAGENIAMTMGLGFAQMTDPANGIPVPVVSQFLVITASLLFLVFNGHLALIQMMADSFQELPVAPVGIGQNGIELLLSWSAKTFANALLVALPAVLALLVVNLAMGVMTRAAPQMNLFSVGFPVTMLIGFVLLFLSLPTFSQVFSSMLREALEFMGTLLRS